MSTITMKSETRKKIRQRAQSALAKMADRIKLWRPVTDVYKWPDVSPWPSIEVPDRVARAILNRLEG